MKEFINVFRQKQMNQSLMRGHGHLSSSTAVLPEWNVLQNCRKCPEILGHPVKSRLKNNITLLFQLQFQRSATDSCLNNIILFKDLRYFANKIFIFVRSSEKRAITLINRQTAVKLELAWLAKMPYSDLVSNLIFLRLSISYNSIRHINKNSNYMPLGCVRSFHERQKTTESEMKGLI